MINANGQSVAGKGSWVFEGNNILVQGIEFSNAAVSNADGENGAGIRLDGTNLTVVKTRANKNYILSNRIGDDTPGSSTSYEIDIPQGGTSYIIGNVIYKGNSAQNPIFVTQAQEGVKNPTNQ